MTEETKKTEKVEVTDKAALLIASMLTENTGSHMLDSGGAYGRNHERNAGKTAADFENEPAVTFDELSETDTKSTDICYGISVYHYLKCQLELDEICEKFNKLQDENSDWDGPFYGVSEKAGNWLKETFDIIQSNTVNSYNGESSLSQVIQYTNLALEYSGDDTELQDLFCGKEFYVILQLHGGCDVRGGYTHARMFKLANDYQYECGFLNCEDVFGSITKPDGTAIQIDNGYNGWSLTDESGEAVEINPETDKIELFTLNE